MKTLKGSKPIPAISEADIRRFWAKVDVRGPDECWPWKGWSDREGYGRIHFFRKGFRSHRVAYYLQHGIDPGELHTCHTCDNPPCCNGAHLWRGTNLENRADSKAKGRMASGDRHYAHVHPELLPHGDRHYARAHPEKMARGERHGSRLHPERLPRGERHPNAKLTAAKVAEIRRRYAAGGVSQTALANEFGVTQGTIGFIARNKTWVQR